jgi:hypothetical protein
VQDGAAEVGHGGRRTGSLEAGVGGKGVAQRSDVAFVGCIECSVDDARERNEERQRDGGLRMCRQFIRPDREIVIPRRRRFRTGRRLLRERPAELLPVALGHRFEPGLGTIAIRLDEAGPGGRFDPRTDGPVTFVESQLQLAHHPRHHAERREPPPRAARERELDVAQLEARRLQLRAVGGHDDLQQDPLRRFEPRNDARAPELGAHGSERLLPAIGQAREEERFIRSGEREHPVQYRRPLGGRQRASA